MRDNLRLYDLRQRLQEIYGWNASSFVFTWVHDKQITSMMNCAMTLKEFTNQSPGVCLVYMIPEHIKPSLPPQPEVDKYDCNHGVADQWIKIAVH